MTRGKRLRVAPPKQFCYIFAHERACKYGEECRFHHSLEEFLGQANFDFYESQRLSALEAQPQLGSGRHSTPPPPFSKAYDTKPNEDSTCSLFVHENAICGLCVGPSHPALTDEAGEITSLQWLVAPGDSIQPNQPLLLLTTTTSQYHFCSPVPGKLVQLNPKLSLQPQLIRTDRENKGFVCLIKATEPYPLMFGHLFSPRTYPLYV